MRILLAILTVLAFLASPLPGKDKEDDGKVITIQDLAYSPATVRIKRGDKVTWINQDQQDHTVDEENGKFSSGNIKSGKKFSMVFEKAGKYRYGCKFHPRMAGVIVVE